MITEYTVSPIKNFGEIQVATMTGVIGNKIVRENKQEHFMPETIEYHSDNLCTFFINSGSIEIIDLKIFFGPYGMS